MASDSSDSESPQHRDLLEESVEGILKQNLTNAELERIRNSVTDPSKKEDTGSDDGAALKNPKENTDILMKSGEGQWTTVLPEPDDSSTDNPKSEEDGDNAALMSAWLKNQIWSITITLFTGFFVYYHVEIFDWFGYNVPYWWAEDAVEYVRVAFVNPAHFSISYFVSVILLLAVIPVTAGLLVTLGGKIIFEFQDSPLYEHGLSVILLMFFIVFTIWASEVVVSKATAMNSSDGLRANSVVLEHHGYYGEADSLKATFIRIKTLEELEAFEADMDSLMNAKGIQPVE